MAPPSFLLTPYTQHSKLVKLVLNAGEKFKWGRAIHRQTERQIFMPIFKKKNVHVYAAWSSNLKQTEYKLVSVYLKLENILNLHNVYAQQCSGVRWSSQLDWHSVMVDLPQWGSAPYRATSLSFISYIVYFLHHFVWLPSMVNFW